MLGDPNGQKSPWSTTPSARASQDCPKRCWGLAADSRRARRRRAARLLGPATPGLDAQNQHGLSWQGTTRASVPPKDPTLRNRGRTQLCARHRLWGALPGKSVRPQKTPGADASRRRTRAQVCLQPAREQGPWVCPFKAPGSHGLSRRQWGPPGSCPAAPRTLLFLGGSRSV